MLVKNKVIKIALYGLLSLLVTESSLGVENKAIFVWSKGYRGCLPHKGFQR